MTTLAVLTPIDPGTGTRVTVRVCSSQDPDATGASGHIWWPAIVVQPALSMSLFDGDFTAAVEPAAANISLRLEILRASGLFPRCERYDWSGAAVTLYRLVSGSPVVLAEMRVDRFASEDDVLNIGLSVDREPFDADVLFNRYAGTTGAEGGADLKDQPKPWAFGRCLNVEPVFIDQIDNVFQVSGYGPVSAISAVYERGASFGSSIGNFASYAALVAADIPEGRWGTCLAEGMFRLGAPPAGVITCDVDGDSTSGFLRRTGAIIAEIARRLGLTAKVNAASLAALDAAVPRNVNILISQQTSLIDLARAMAAPCNAVGGIALDGRLIMPRVAFGSEQMVLDAQGRQMPPVLGMARQNTSAPYAEIRMGAAQSHRVHSFEEIAFFAELIDRGIYDAAQTYREGNIVESADKSRWVYINPTASSGNAPPSWPTTANAFWSSLAPPLDPEAIGVEAGATRNTGALADLDVINAGGPEFVGNLPGTRVDGDFGGNFIADPIFGEGWVYSNAAYSPGGSGGNLYDRHRAVFLGEGVIWFVGTGFPALERAAVVLGETYYFSGWFFRSSSATGHVVARVELYDATGANIGVEDIPGTSTVGMATNAWTRLQGQWTCPAGVAYVRPLVGNNTGGNTSTIFVGLPYFGRHQPGADVTATAQRSIEPQFPVIEVKQGEAGHTGDRTVTHTAKRGTATLTGGTWSLPSQNLGAGSASINSSTGTVTLSGIVQSGAYSVRYTHTDGIVTELAVNVTYVPTATAAPVTGIRNEFATTTAGTANNNLWQSILSATVIGAPAGTANLNSFGRSRLNISSGTGTADFEARLLLGGVEVAFVASQNVVTGGVMSFTDFTDLFDDAYSTPAGNVTFEIQLRRTSGTGRILTTNTRLDVTIIST